MKNSPINPVFKTVFTAFLKEFFPCDEFINAIKGCKTYQEINVVFMLHADNIADELGVKPVKISCTECDEKDDEISDLEKTIKELENLGTNQLIDKMKMECFVKNHAKFSLEHFRKLME